MNVLFLSAWWPTSVHPFHGNFVEKHARIVALDHDLVVLSVQVDASVSGSARIEHSTEADYHSVVVYYGSSGGLGRYTKRLAAWIKGLRYVSRHFTRPDLIHGHVILDGGAVAYLASRWWRVPYVVSAHATKWLRGGYSRVKVSVARRVCRKAAFVLPVSDYLRQALVGRHRVFADYRIVGNVVNTQLFQPGKVGPPDGAFRFLHVSNFDDRAKNVTGILQAFGRLGRPAHLTIAGDGNIPWIKQRIAQLDLPLDRITVSGPHNEKEIAAFMRSHHAFVLFSNYETQGVVVLEAQCCGLPCILSKVGPLKERIPDEALGMFVEKGNIAELATAMEWCISNYGQFDSARIRREILRHCSTEEVRKLLLTVYSDSLSA